MDEREGHRGIPLAVERDDLREVDVRQGVAGDDKERTVEISSELPYGSSSTEGRFFDAVPKAHPNAATVSVAVLDDRREVLEGDERLLDAVTLQELEDVSEAGLVDDRHHRLWSVDRQRSKTASLTARHDDGLHRPESSSGPVRSDREQRLEVMARVGLERHVGLCPRHAGHLGDPPSHDVGELVVLPGADHRHEIKIAGDRVNLGHAVDRRKLLPELRQRAFLGRDQDDRRNHRLPAQSLGSAEETRSRLADVHLADEPLAARSFI